MWAFRACASKVTTRFARGFAASIVHYTSKATYTTRFMSGISGEGEQSKSVTDAMSRYTELTVKDWGGRWEEGQTGFHKLHVAPLLLKHIQLLVNGREKLKVLVPLCGKSLDMKWLADQGHTVVGVEGVEQPVLEFFSEQNLEYIKEPQTDIDGDLYKSTDGLIYIYRCDFFDFNRSLQGNFDIIWDKAAFVAINRGDREKYANHIKTLASPDCRMMIVTVDFDETQWPGPPHYTPDGTIAKLYGDEYDVSIVDRSDAMEDRWIDRGVESIDEVAHFLTRKGK